VSIAFIGGIVKFSGGEVKSYPSFHYHQTPKEVERFENDFRRYLQRKIGFEAVMRLRTPPGFILFSSFLSSRLHS
jgi:protein transport protein SEC24